MDHSGAAPLRAWRRRMGWTGAIVATAGAGCMAVGTVRLGASGFATGPWAYVAAVGVLALVIGVFCVRLCVAGPFPTRFGHGGG